MKSVISAIVMMFVSHSAVAEVPRCAPDSEYAAVAHKMHELVQSAAIRLVVTYNALYGTSATTSASVFVLDNPVDDETYFVVSDEGKSCAFVASGETRRSLILAINNDRGF